MSTIRVPESVPSPNQDSETLRKAVQGFGTDEKAITLVLGRRNASQRSKIRETYQQLYNENLIDRLKSELSGDFAKAVVLWTLDPPERDAKVAHEFLRKKGVCRLQAIVEIACANSPFYLMEVRKVYCALFGCSLEEDIVSHVALPVRRLLVALVSSFRYDREVVDRDVAELEAAKLHDAISSKQLDHDDIIHILSTRNVFQLRATFQAYKKNHGKSIDEAIKSCGKGDMESLLQAVVGCIDRPEKHFAEVVRASILGLGTDEDSLTRVLVTRAEIDLMRIKGDYNNIYGTSLDNAIIDDTSGDYKDFLMTLLGARI